MHRYSVQIHITYIVFYLFQSVVVFDLFRVLISAWNEHQQRVLDFSTSYK